MQSFMCCPICKEEAHVVPIEINIQKGTTGADFRYE